MAVIILDEFSVKPAGVLAKWRYRRVFIDSETKLIGSGCIVGKECMNLPSISDYNKVSRRFKAGDLITTFCDFVTFERVSVFAQDTEPFAYATIETNVAACGFNQPLPTPAVIPNPWGTVPYGLYKTYDFCDKTGNYSYEILIYKKEFSGSSTRIPTAGSSPVVMSYKRDKQHKYDPIVGCQVSLTFQASADFDISELYTDDERQFKVVINRNGSLFFTGYIVPDIAREQFKAYPYDVTVTVTDGLALLKKQQYPLPVKASLVSQQRFIDMLAFCFAQTGLTLDIVTICNLYEQKMANGLNDDPLAQASANPLRLADDKGNIADTYTALIEICKVFGAFVCQVNGAWHFVRSGELTGIPIRSRRYNYTAFFLNGTLVSPYRTISHDPGDVEQINVNATKYRGAAYKYVNALMKYGFVPSAILNGDFEQWDGQNFPYWTANGGINFSRIQKSVIGSNGQPFLIDNYMLQFNEEFSPYKNMKAFPFTVGQGDQISFTMNLGSLYARDGILFRMRVGEYWLKNVGARNVIADQTNGTFSIADNGKYEWIKTGLATATFVTEDGSKDINFYQVQIDIPPLPAFGELEIFICGVRKFLTTATMTNGVVTETLVPAPYSPVQFDNISVGVSKNPSENTPNGILYKSLQDKNYTSSFETEVMFGDYTEDKRSIRGSVYNPLKNTLHPIFTADNSFSKLWYDYGFSTEKLPIIAYLAKNILRAYQRTLIMIDLDLLGLDLSILTIFQVCSITGKRFMVLSGDMDLKSNQFKNVTLVETFETNVQSQDNSVINMPALKFMSIPQDPNGSPYLLPEDNDGRIFYPPYSPEFT